MDLTPDLNVPLQVEKNKKQGLYFISSLVLIAVAALLYFGIRQAMLERQPISQNINVEFTAGEKATFEERIAASLATLKDSPEDFGAYTSLATSYEGLGNYVEAEKTYKKMNELFSKNILSFQNLGNLYRRQGHYEAAAEMYLTTIANAPRKADVMRPLVDLYTFNIPSRKSEIPVMLENALKELPTNVELWRMLAAYHYEAGPKDKALETYEKLLEYDLDNETARREYESLLP